MHRKVSPLVVATALAATPVLAAPAVAGASEPVCYTVLVTGPDGEPRWVTVCVPPERI